LTNDSNAIIIRFMAQLLVRNVESAVVKKLRTKAAAQGVSVEEAHRRLLRSSLMGDGPAAESNFIEYLQAVPQGDHVEFPRDRSLPRKVAL